MWNWLRNLFSNETLKENIELKSYIRSNIFFSKKNIVICCPEDELKVRNTRGFISADQYYMVCPLENEIGCIGDSRYLLNKLVNSL